MSWSEYCHGEECIIMIWLMLCRPRSWEGVLGTVEGACGWDGVRRKVVGWVRRHLGGSDMM